MRSMQKGDKAFFYHSNCKPPGIVGLMEVIETRLTDPSQFDVNSKYYDPKSVREAPKWDCVKLKYIGKFCSIISLEELRSIFLSEDLPVVKKGNRLSILPVPKNTAKELLEMAGELI